MSEASARSRRPAPGARRRLAGQGLREPTGSPVLHGAVEDAQEGTGVAVPRFPCGRPQDRRWPRAAERPTAPTQGASIPGCGWSLQLLTGGMGTPGHRRDAQGALRNGQADPATTTKATQLGLGLVVKWCETGSDPQWRQTTQTRRRRRPSGHVPHRVHDDGPPQGQGNRHDRSSSPLPAASLARACLRVVRDPPRSGPIHRRDVP